MPVTAEMRELQLTTSYLLMIKDPVPVAAGSDWREATRQACHAYGHRKRLEYLPLVYEEYQQRQS